MARDFQLSIVASFRDKATRGIKSLQRTLKTGWGGSLGRTLGAKSGPLGQLAALPTRIAGSLASLVPAVGPVFGGLVSSAGNILGGLVGVVSGVVTRMVKAFAALGAGFVRVAGRVVSAVTSTLGRLGKVAAGIALGTGALIGWQLTKGIRENMRLADVRQALRKLLGSAAKDAEKYARALSLRSPFTPMESLLGVRGIAATFGRDYQRALRGAMDLAAGSGGRLEEAVMAMQRGRTGQFGEAGEALRRMLISRADLERAGARFGGGGQFLGTSLEYVEAALAAIQRRFGGMAEEAAKVGGGPWSTFVGAVQDLRVNLAEPWYDRFNTALSQLNGHLLALGQSQTWGRVVTWSERMAEALDTRLRGAIEWLKAQSWQDVWSGFTEGLRAIPGQLAAVAGALKDAVVPLGQALLAGFQWVFEDLRGRFRLLWNDVLGDFYNDLVVNLTGAGAALAEQALASVERRAREAKGLTPAEWAALNPAGRATAVSHWRMKPGNWGASWGLEATRQAGAGLAGVAAGLPFAQKRPGDQIRAETAAAAGAALGRFLEAMGRTEAQLAKLTDALVPVTGPMAGGFRSPAPAGAEQAVDPAALRTARAYAQKVSVAGQLEKAGYVAQAAEAWQQAAALRQEMEELLPAMLQNDLRMNQQLKSITAQVRRLQTRYKRLATGRT